MSDDLKKVAEDLGRTWHEYKATNDQALAEVKDLGAQAAETKAKLSKMDEAIDNASKAINELEKKIQRPAVPAEDKSSERKLAERKAFLAFALQGQNGATKDFSPTESKVMSVADATTGGIFAMPEILSGILRAVVEISPFRQNANVRTTSRESVRLRKEITVGSYGWTGEQTTRTETTNPRFGWEIVPVHEIYAMVDITRWDLEDADFNFENELAYQASTQMAKAEGAAFHSGDGVGKPLGFSAGATTSTLGNDTFTGDDLIEMVYGIKTDYLANAKWYANRNTIAACRKLKDGISGNYLWQPGLNAQPASLLGYPVVECVDMADVGNATRPIAFGDFRRHYTVIDRLDMQVQRDDVTQAATGAVRFWFRRRVGGQPVNLEAMLIGLTT